MYNYIKTNWWALELRGLLAILFGLVTLFVPGFTLAALIIVFGIFAFGEGIVHMIAAFKKRTEEWWTALIQGVLGILIGIVAFVWPGMTALALLMLIAFWSFITGIVEITAAVRLRKEITGEWTLILSGIVSLLFAIILFSRPGVGALGLIWVIGIYAVIFGSLLMILGMKVHGELVSKSEKRV